MKDVWILMLMVYFANMAFDLFMGQLEALFFHYGWHELTKAKNKALHGMLFVSRTLVGLMISVPMGFLIWDPWPFTLWVLSLILSFPFMHDGAYYVVRHDLNHRIYPKGWFDQSTTSVAWTDKWMTARLRIIFLLQGILALTISIYLTCGKN